MIENIIHVVVALINLICIGYLIYVIAGLIRYGKNVFQHRHKVLSIIILVLTIVHISSQKKNDDESKSMNFTSTVVIPKNIFMDDSFFNNISMFTQKIDNSNTYEVIASFSGLNLGVDFQEKNTQVVSENNQLSIQLRYVKIYSIYGVTIYKQPKTIAKALDGN
ncbi:MAG: hypothetical protein ACSHWW_13575 [Nonlabens sp.]|uniref:hypothetical protein n=1 Tax=Nonlabens sp. TaxID=1888209 RepID=UPI003EF46AA7